LFREEGAHREGGGGTGALHKGPESFKPSEGNREGGVVRRFLKKGIAAEDLGQALVRGAIRKQGRISQKSFPFFATESRFPERRTGPFGPPGKKPLFTLFSQKNHRRSPTSRSISAKRKNTPPGRSRKKPAKKKDSVPSRKGEELLLFIKGKRDRIF